MKLRLTIVIFVLAIFNAGCAENGLTPNPIQPQPARPLHQLIQLPAVAANVVTTSRETLQSLRENTHFVELPAIAKNTQRASLKPAFYQPAPPPPGSGPPSGVPGGGGSGGPVNCYFVMPRQIHTSCGGGGAGGGGGGGAYPKILNESQGYVDGHFYVTCAPLPMNAKISVTYGNLAAGVGQETISQINIVGQTMTFAFPSPEPAGNFITAEYTVGTTTVAYCSGAS